MPASPVATVLVHVDDVAAALRWYQQAFVQARPARDGEFAYLVIDSVQLELVPADEKVGSGAAGSVVYWQVADLGAAITHMHGIGAALYRGPLQMNDGLGMCQVRDPWGNCIGLRGPMRAERDRD